MAHLEAASDPDVVRGAVEAELGKPTGAGRPANALAQIDATLARIGQRFEWGDIDADEYRTRRAEMLAVRAEVEQSQARAQAPRLVLAGVVDAWDTEDAMTRRQLLWALFDELDVSSGAIVGARPRREVEAEVATYLAGWPGLHGAPLRVRLGGDAGGSATGVEVAAR